MAVEHHLPLQRLTASAAGAARTCVLLHTMYTPGSWSPVAEAVLPAAILMVQMVPRA
jgi:hypothetical protein